MSWIRAVWVEGDAEVEGVLPSVWRQGSFIRWPLKNVLSLAKANTPPSQNWMSFELKKIKFSSDNRKDCDKHDETTSTEIDDEYSAVVCGKRTKQKRNFGPDFVTLSEVESAFESGLVMNASNTEREISSFPTPPRLQIPEVQNELSAEPTTDFLAQEADSPCHIDNDSLPPVKKKQRANPFETFSDTSPARPSEEVSGEEDSCSAVSSGSELSSADKSCPEVTPRSGYGHCKHSSSSASNCDKSRSPLQITPHEPRPSDDSGSSGNPTAGKLSLLTSVSSAGNFFPLFRTTPSSVTNEDLGSSFLTAGNLHTPVPTTPQSGPGPSKDLGSFVSSACRSRSRLSVSGTGKSHRKVLTTPSSKPIKDSGSSSPIAGKSHTPVLITPQSGPHKSLGSSVPSAGSPQSCSSVPGAGKSYQKVGATPCSGSNKNSGSSFATAGKSRTPVLMTSQCGLREDTGSSNAGFSSRSCSSVSSTGKSHQNVHTTPSTGPNKDYGSSFATAGKSRTPVLTTSQCGPREDTGLSVFNAGSSSRSCSSVCSTVKSSKSHQKVNTRPSSGPIKESCSSFPSAGKSRMPVLVSPQAGSRNDSSISMGGPSRACSSVSGIGKLYQKVHTTPSSGVNKNSDSSFPSAGKSRTPVLVSSQAGSRNDSSVSMGGPSRACSSVSGIGKLHQKVHTTPSSGVNKNSGSSFPSAGKSRSPVLTAPQSGPRKETSSSASSAGKSIPPVQVSSHPVPSEELMSPVHGTGQSTDNQEYSRVEKRLLFELAKLVQQVKNLNNEVKELRHIMESASGTVRLEKVEIPEIVKGPITTFEDLDTFMDRCGNKDVQSHLFDLLRRIGGQSFKEATRNILNRLFSNFLMSFMNLDGRCVGKKAMRNQPICSIIEDAVLHRYGDVTIADIHKVIADHLKQAPNRTGGAGKGCHLTVDVADKSTEWQNESFVSECVEERSEYQNDDGSECDDVEESDVSVSV